MRHLKKFENTQEENIFKRDEIGDIINEFADSFDIEEVDDIIIYPDIDSYGSDPSTFLGELSEIDHGITTSFKICIPYDYDYSDFNDLCNTYIKTFNTLKSLNGKMEMFNVEILEDYFFIDFDLNSIVICLEKI